MGGVATWWWWHAKARGSGGGGGGTAITQNLEIVQIHCKCVCGRGVVECWVQILLHHFGSFKFTELGELAVCSLLHAAGAALRLSGCTVLSYSAGAQFLNRFCSCAERTPTAAARP